MAKDVTSPVWDVYDAIRTSRLNAKGYGCRVSALERESFWIELTAATATGSVIAGFAFWSTTAGKPIWEGLMVVSAILAIAKPLLKLSLLFGFGTKGSPDGNLEVLPTSNRVSPTFEVREARH